MTARTPDQAAILAAASLEAIPPLPRSVPVPPATASRAASTSAISSMRVAASSIRGSAVMSPDVSVRRSEEVGADQVGDEGGEAVVVAVADLVVGHRVVLVDDRHGAEVEEAAQGLAGVEVLGAVDEVVGGEQHLAGHQAVGGQDGAEAAP